MRQRVAIVVVFVVGGGGIAAFLDKVAILLL
jgi:hypothetical protein